MASVAGAGPSRQERLRALAAWLGDQEGASAAWDALEVADCGQAGFGFRATKAIAKGAVLCTIPLRIAFSVDAARSSPTLGPLLRQCSGLRDDDVIGACRAAPWRVSTSSATAAWIQDGCAAAAAHLLRRCV